MLLQTALRILIISFCLSHHPTNEQAVDAQGDGWGHVWDS